MVSRFGFVEFLSKEEDNCAIKIMIRFKVYGKLIQIFISKQTKENKESNHERVGQHLHWESEPNELNLK